jgi:hypothetical protein
VGFGGHSSTSECSKVRKQRLLDDPRLSRLKLSSDTLGGGDPKRERFLARMPSIKAICANRLFPSFAEWHLAKTGYDRDA